MNACPLIRQPVPASFHAGWRTLSQSFRIYAITSPQPLPATGLLITPEIRHQSELYLPIKQIRQLFNRLYCQCLNYYPPTFTNSPFHNALSWADCFGSLPAWLQISPDPALLLKRLLEDEHLLVRFIFYSFLPARFNGAGFGRYPAQLDWLRQHLSGKSHTGLLRILDAACGSGEGTWELAELLADIGWKPEQVQIEGWTLEPLEVWAAEQQSLPHDPERGKSYQQRVQPLLKQGWGNRVSFKAVDLLGEVTSSKAFDLILCNGLLGGPIINQQAELRQVAALLVGLLAPGGVFMIANRFHEGWKRRMPEELLGKLLNEAGLQAHQAGEGLAGIKPYTSPA